MRVFTHSLLDLPAGDRECTTGRSSDGRVHHDRHGTHAGLARAVGGEKHAALLPGRMV